MVWRVHGSSNPNPSFLCPEANQIHKGGPDLSLLGVPAALAHSLLSGAPGLSAQWGFGLLSWSFVVLSSVPGSAWFLLETHSTLAERELVNFTTKQVAEGHPGIVATPGETTYHRGFWKFQSDQSSQRKEEKIPTDLGGRWLMINEN